MKTFSPMSWQNDQTAEAMGKHLQDSGIKSVYLMAPNYQAGKDMLSGVKRYYEGKVAGEVYTKLGQTDFQAELSALRAAKPETTMIFQPGGMGINFVKQWKQAGMDSVSKLYTVFTVDGVSLPALKDSAIGIMGTQTWSPDLDNPINRKFVSDYKSKHGAYPSFYAAQAYDTILAIDHAIKKSGSTETAKMRAVLAKGNIPTTRGSLKMNTNHFQYKISISEKRLRTLMELLPQRLYPQSLATMRTRMQINANFRSFLQLVVFNFQLQNIMWYMKHNYVVLWNSHLSLNRPLTAFKQV